MAYSSANLKLWEGGAINRWVYATTDELPTILATGYFSDAGPVSGGAAGKGMKAGDRITVRRFTDVADVTTFVESFELDVTLVNATTGVGTAKLHGLGLIETATATAGAATLAALRGLITTESLTTPAAAEYTLTITNSLAAVGDLCFATVDAGSSAGTPGIGGVTVTAGQIVITVTNLHAANAFNNTLKVGFRLEKP
jgi:hypothetical protein